MKATPGRVLPEPDLIFGNQQHHKDPKVGLREHGPYHFKSERRPTPTAIRVGVIAAPHHMTEIRRLLDHLRSPVTSRNHNRFLRPHFPGFNEGASLLCDFVVADPWTLPITIGDIERIQKVTHPHERIALCARIIAEKVGSLRGDDKPDVVIVGIPQEIDETCGKGKAGRGPKPTDEEREVDRDRALNQPLSLWVDLPEIKTIEKDFDLHNAIKAKVMKHRIPVQLLRERTSRGVLAWLEGDSQDPPKNTGIYDPSEFAWNFSTALYYKANGRPWRLTELTPGTCYVGIAFYKNRRSAANDLQFSMAQVFTHNLEGFVIRGTEVVRDERTWEAHMSASQAEDLLRRAIARYTEKEGRPPNRVVVHKTSRFSAEEREGVGRAIGSCRRDLVALNGTPVRFFRRGDYPVLRGTTIKLTDREYLLYTSGYVPSLRTYPGARVPEPLLLTHEGDSEVHHVAQEILGLTKLDWNTTSFNARVPITIGFAQRVGNVLTELQNDADLVDEYRFYM